MVVYELLKKVRICFLIVINFPFRICSNSHLAQLKNHLTAVKIVTIFEFLRVISVYIITIVYIYFINVVYMYYLM